MKNIASLTLSLFLVSCSAFADTPKTDESQAAAPAKTTKKAPRKPDAVAQQLEELRQALQAQQAQLSALKEELAKRDRQIDEAREAAAAANSRAADASSKATEAATATAEVKSSESSLNSTVGDLKVSNDALKSTIEQQETAAKKAAIEGPPAIRYKGITITPGGFVAAETVSRTRALSGDINTPFSIPYPGASLTKVSENSFTSRQSRVSLLAESKVGDSARLTGYYEADWLGTGVTSNNRQSNSYVLRQRQIWAQAAFNNGFSVTAGQTWSLATENKQGIQTRGEAIPMTIDSQYNVGFSWARQYGFRIVKDFGGKFALALAVEGPQATIGGRGFSLATTTTVGTAAVATTGNTFLDAPGAGAGLFNFSDTTGYSVNKAPDIIVKAAVDPGFGHYELFGILSTFRNRVFPCGVVGTNAKDTVAPAVTTTLNCAPDPTNPNPVPSSLGAYDDTRTGGGLGASLRVPLFSKKLDFGVKGVAGDGIGRYGSAQIADLTFRPNGTQALIRTTHGLAILEFHPNSKLDVFAYFGGEYGWRAAYQGYNSIAITKTPAIPAVPPSASFPSGSPAIGATTTTTFRLNQIGGYGSPFANNSGCGMENPPTNQLTPSGGGSCAGDTRAIDEGTLGFWYKFYQGPKGGLRLGLQYSYFSRNGWSGNNSANGNSSLAGISPKAIDNMVWTSLRYYIP